MVMPAISVSRACTDGAGDAVGQRLAQHLVVPRRLVVGMQQQVRVALDEAGHAASVPGSATRSAPAGAVDLRGRAGRVDRASPRTSTTQPSCIVSPSKTRAGCSSTTASAGVGAAR